VSGLTGGVRQVTDSFAVAAQLTGEDIAEAAAAGVRLIVNNRPDDEEPGQPSSRELADAARESGVSYLHLPVRGGPTREQVDQMTAALDDIGGPAIAFCRSGMRSIFTWGIGQQLSGKMSRDEIVEAARQAGYDLGAYLPD
jgi:uncharacterized protein (TIGR01244 family)